MNDPIVYWNGPMAQRWVDEKARLDRMLLPFGEAALASAQASAGETVLDVGCGCGDTTVALASKVGDRGRVVGVDPSAAMLGRARELCGGRANVSLVAGDAAVAPLGRGTFDLVFSRFGVMFFADPVAAFTHLRGALRGGGRLAFVCWRPLAENPWAAVPFEAAAAVVGRPEPAPEGAPGPFSFSDPARVRRILEAAGFADVTLRAVEAPVSFGESPSLDEATQKIAQLGPVARLLVDRDPATVTRALVAVRAAIAPYARAEGGVHFHGATWVVTARNG